MIVPRGWLPHIYRPLKPDRLRMRLPYRPRNRAWIHAALGERIQLRRDREEQNWVIARDHFTALVDELLDEFGVVYVSVEFSTTERCDSNCQRATRDDCQCSCLGEYHGGGLWGGWVEVGETTLIRSDTQLRHMRLTR